MITPGPFPNVWGSARAAVTVDQSQKLRVSYPLHKLFSRALQTDSTPHLYEELGKKRMTASDRPHKQQNKRVERRYDDWAKQPILPRAFSEGRIFKTGYFIQY